MIKTVIISLAVLSGVGTSAMAVDVVKPKTIEVSAGTLMFSFDKDGVSTEITEKSDYALRMKTQKGNIIAIRF